MYCYDALLVSDAQSRMKLKRLAGNVATACDAAVSAKATLNKATEC